MPAFTNDFATCAAAATFTPLIAVMNDQIDIIPVTAGITGAFVAGMRKHDGTLRQSPLRWLTTIIAGASASVFVSPFLCVDLLHLTSVRLAILIHFVIGLLGSAIVDAILSREKAIANAAVDKVIKQ